MASFFSASNCARSASIRSLLFHARRGLHMVTDVPLDQFGHQAAQRAAGGGGLLEDRVAVSPFLNRSFDSFDLPTDAADSGQQFLPPSSLM